MEGRQFSNVSAHLHAVVHADGAAFRLGGAAGGSGVPDGCAIGLQSRVSALMNTWRRWMLRSSKQQLSAQRGDEVVLLHNLRHGGGNIVCTPAAIHMQTQNCTFQMDKKHHIVKLAGGIMLIAQTDRGEMDTDYSIHNDVRWQKMAPSPACGWRGPPPRPSCCCRRCA